MEKDLIIKALKAAKENSKGRKFKQSYDLIINLKDLNIKNPDEKVDFFTQLPHSKGKKTKVCALVGGELFEQAKKVCDTAILVDDFPKYQADKKLQKKIADEHDLIVAQATIMPKVAGTFGKVLGPKGKMPNPKAGCVVPPNANLQPLYDRLQNTVRIITRAVPTVQVIVGKEDMKDEEVVENILTTYNQVIHHVPKEKNNIRSIFLKLTMGVPVKIGTDIEVRKKEEKKPKAKKEERKKPKEKKKEEDKKPEKEKKKEAKKEEPKKETESKKEEVKEGAK